MPRPAAARKPHTHYPSRTDFRFPTHRPNGESSTRPALMPRCGDSCGLSDAAAGRGHSGPPRSVDTAAGQGMAHGGRPRTVPGAASL